MTVCLPSDCLDEAQPGQCFQKTHACHTVSGSEGRACFKHAYSKHSGQIWQATDVIGAPRHTMLSLTIGLLFLHLHVCEYGRKPHLFSWPKQISIPPMPPQVVRLMSLAATYEVTPAGAQQACFRISSNNYKTRLSKLLSKF